MSSILASLPLLLCPIGMCTMMWLMSRSKNRSDASAAVDSGRLDTPASVEVLKEEHRRLARQIEQLEDGSAAPRR